MGITHENLLHGIESDFPEEVGEATKYEGVNPPVSKEYLMSLCEGDEELTAYFEDMLEYFYRYTRDVCAQESLKHERDGIQKNREEILALDISRSALHNAMIDSVRIFARHLAAKGKDVTWFNEVDKKSRIGYANLALLTTFKDILTQNHD